MKTTRLYKICYLFGLITVMMLYLGRAFADCTMVFTPDPVQSQSPSGAHEGKGATSYTPNYKIEVVIRGEERLATKDSIWTSFKGMVQFVNKDENSGKITKIRGTNVVDGVIRGWEIKREGAPYKNEKDEEISKWVIDGNLIYEGKIYKIRDGVHTYNAGKPGSERSM